MNTSARKLRIVFMGTAPFALPTLRSLADTEEVIAVITQPDRPRGRGREVAPSPTKGLARDLGLEVLQPERVNDPHFISQLEKLKPDVIVVAAFGQILTPAVLDLPPLGCINVHPSLLPKYRGAAPINWAIINGEPKTGVTTYFMDEGMDTGPILLVREIEIGADETAEELGEQLAALGGELAKETIQGLKEKGLQPIPQDEKAATYAPLLKKADGLIQWEGKADRIRNQIRGLLPWPVAFTWWEGKRMKLFRARIGDGTGAPGEITAVETGLEVACGTGSLFIEELQLEGGNKMGWEEFT
ncbi:MAG TPA: methionyl-tRNA formyltransferase, partial [Synergistetes bacterium]|nr:methionyl-tRNA formyltransferase [Synergistota bacterium]